MTSPAPLLPCLMSCLALALGCARLPSAEIELTPERPRPRAVAVETSPDPVSEPRPASETVTPTAESTEAGTAEAKRLFTEAQARYQAGDVAGALELFERAYAYAPLPALAYNIAHCYEQLGRGAEACAVYRRLVQEGDDSITESADQAAKRLGC